MAIMRTVLRHVAGPLSSYYRSLQDPAYSTLCRKLGRVPRYTPGSISIAGWDLEYVDSASLISAYDIIVRRRLNDFLPDSSSPFILDCGANIGLSSLHYKRLWPAATVVAFEPDRTVAAVLRRNLARNGAGDVEVVEAAVWDRTGTMPFLAEGADAGRLIAGSDTGEGILTRLPTARKYQVPTLRLADYLHGKTVSLLKMDIEGAEDTVLADCAGALGGVQNIVMEFHLMTSQPTRLAATLDVLAREGFAVSVISYGPWVHLTQKPNSESLGIEPDQSLCISAWRLAPDVGAPLAPSQRTE